MVLSLLSLSPVISAFAHCTTVRPAIAGAAYCLSHAHTSMLRAQAEGLACRPALPGHQSLPQLTCRHLWGPSFQARLCAHSVLRGGTQTSAVRT
jgi:hypothetical protein